MRESARALATWFSCCFQQGSSASRPHSNLSYPVAAEKARRNRKGKIETLAKFRFAFSLGTSHEEAASRSLRQGYYRRGFLYGKKGELEFLSSDKQRCGIDLDSEKMGVETCRSLLPRVEQKVYTMNSTAQIHSRKDPSAVSSNGSPKFRKGDNVFYLPKKKWCRVIDYDFKGNLYELDPPEQDGCYFWASPDNVTAKPPSKKQSSNKKHWVRTHLRTLREFTEETVSKLTPAEISIWIVLFQAVRNEEVCMSQREIARKVGKTQPKVNAAIKKLIERGLLKVVRQGHYDPGNHSQKSVSVYKICGK